ncbi:uncharacterized protein LOC130579520 [Malurus melanocephalus]|uniref:uncharacterized protein LOC130579520 n=1 Tax=Malurus melanocephalus TaxID=175006 RepID=UPI0025474AB5|nr:uncharacterized protein LOC130579520 [Malurus melanocephalus]XP_057232356.1 uncharacterized protein LOC130579520 [Malurus melanocephalus]
MELWLADTFLPLLLLTCLPAGTVSQLADRVITVQFEICSQNVTVQMKWDGPERVEVENQTNSVVVGKNSTNLTNSCMCTAHTGIRVCKVFITRPNSTDTGNSTRTPDFRCDSAGSQTDVTGNIWTGLSLLLCILLGLAVGTLLYMPVIGFLLWRCRRNRTGELSSEEVVEGNQVSTAALVTGTEDLTYANLKFEKKGTEPASSNVIYTEIKPSQQKQSGDGSAASTEVNISPKEEGK